MTLYTQLHSFGRLLCVQSPRPALRYATGLVLVRASPRHPHCMETTVNKTHRLDLRVTEDERKQIAQKAESAGLKVSEYLRRSALGLGRVAPLATGSEPPAILTKPERAQLASMANNLNQLTRYAHTGQFDLAGIQGLITQLTQLLA